jgi:hypothetical protein
MNSNISEYQLAKLARLSSKVVNSLTMTDSVDQMLQRHRFSDFLHMLEQQYQNSALLFDARCAIERLSECKNDFYVFSRDLIRMVRGSEAAHSSDILNEADRMPLWNINNNVTLPDSALTCH